MTWYRKTRMNRDPVTNWPAISWLTAGDFVDIDYDCDDFLCESVSGVLSIKAMFRKLGVRETDQHAGRMTEQRIQMEVGVLVEHLDRIVYNGQIYEVESVPVDHNLRGVFRYRTCTLVFVGDE